MSGVNTAHKACVLYKSIHFGEASRQPPIKSTLFLSEMVQEAGQLQELTVADEAIQTEPLHLNTSTDDQVVTGEFVSDRVVFKPSPDIPITCILITGGLTISGIFGVACVALGVTILRLSFALSASPEHIHLWNRNLWLYRPFPFMRELLLLCLNLTFVQLAVWSTGSAHDTTLRWMLATKKDCLGQPHLQYNSNLRFLQASHRWYSANGIFANSIMALCLAVTHAASSMILLGEEERSQQFNTGWLFYFRSPSGQLAFLQPLYQLRRRAGWCMNSMVDEHILKPVRPKMIQNSGWERHPQVRTFVLFLWFFMSTGYYWCVLITAMMIFGTQGVQSDGMQFGWTNEAPTSGILWALMAMVGLQGVILTTAFTIATMLNSVTRDETLWKEAATKHGSDEFPSTLKMLFPNWKSITVHIAKPVLHWFFGMAAEIFTVSARRIKYDSPQLSAFGHLQTLVDLVDEWHPKMYWGHKCIGSKQIALSSAVAMCYGDRCCNDC
ncbi:hypothetical protein NEOLEDRAFT_1146935 [Neolentinus lepideus HHB14362 ss-1]|uniref:Uncharacterized protein n=1 Tax=Neolentinus lepideus HHB14362 ss-1 TaxID=1314782 RepID=A0A165TRD8_9AGAM|nr:hypothetical protein NEOLEDRAFT_1146935 [Neolentinus lepideus HHB14362 ss-1]